MFCPKCGTWMPEDVPTCLQCGAKNEYFTGGSQRAEDAPEDMLFRGADAVQAAPVEPKQGREERKMVVAMAVLAAVIAVFVMIFVVGDVGTDSRKVNLFYSAFDYSHFLFFNAKGEMKAIEGISGNTFVSESGDRTRAVYINPTDATLYYIDSRLKPLEITGRAVQAQFSLTGERFAYLTDSDARFSGLYIYDIKKKKSRRISSDVYSDFICLSPNGKSVAYMKNYLHLYNNELYLCSGGKESILVERDGCIPVAVSNDGKTLFYIRPHRQVSDDGYTCDLYYFDGKDSVQISEDIEFYQMFTNRSVSELLYNKDSQTYYFSVEQGETKCVGQNHLIMMASDTTAYMDNQIAIICDLDTLTNAFYRDGDSVIWLDKEGLQPVNIASGDVDYEVSEDGRTMVYLSDGSLYQVHDVSADTEAELLYEGLAATELVASADLSHIYLITKDNELYHYHDSGHVTELSDDLQSDWGLAAAYSEIDKKIYFIEDGTLYCASATDNKKQVAQDVQSVFADNGSVMYYMNSKEESAYYLVTKHGAVKIFSLREWLEKYGQGME